MKNIFNLITLCALLGFAHSSYAKEQEDAAIVDIQYHENQSLGSIMASLGVMPLNRESEPALKLQALNNVKNLWAPLTQKIKIPKSWIRLRCNTETTETGFKIVENIKNADRYIDYLQKNRTQCWHNYKPSSADVNQIESFSGEYTLGKNEPVIKVLEAIGVTQLWYQWGGIATVVRDSKLKSSAAAKTGDKLVFINIPITKKCNVVRDENQNSFKLRDQLIDNCHGTPAEKTPTLALELIKPIEPVKVEPIKILEKPKPVAMAVPKPVEVTKEIVPTVPTVVEPSQDIHQSTFHKNAFYFRRPYGYYFQGGLSQIKQNAPEALTVPGLSADSQITGARLGAGLWKNNFSAQAMFRTAIETTSGRDYHPSWLNVLAGYGTEYKNLSTFTPYLMPLVGFEYYYNNYQIPGMRNLQSYLGANLGFEARFVVGSKVEVGGMYLMGYSKSVDKNFTQADVKYWVTDSDSLGLGYWSDKATQRTSSFSESNTAVELYYRKVLDF